MAVDPQAPISQGTPVTDPGFFDGQIQGGLPGSGDEVEVAGLGRLAPPLVKALLDARRKVKSGEYPREGIESPATEPTPTPEPAPVVDTPVRPIDDTLAPDESGPVLPELTDPLRAPDADAHAAPGAVTTPTRFDRDDPYERYITVTDESVDAAIHAPENRAELLDEGLSDFNSEKIIDEAGIQERIEVISREFAGEIGGDKRDVVSHAETKQLADLLGMSPKKLVRAMLGRKRGQAIEVEGVGMVETMHAAKQLLISEMRKLDALAEVAKVGSDTDVMAFRYQFELVANLQRNFKGAQTEIARTLSAMRIPATGAASDPALVGEMAARGQRDLTVMLNEYGGATDVRAMAEMYSSIGEPHQKSAFVKGVSKIRATGDALYEVWQHALLTNPVSQTKNLLGNVLTIFTSNAATLAAATIGTARRAVGGVTFSDLGAKVFGQTMSLYTAIKFAGRAFATGQPQLPGTRIDKAQAQGRQHVNAFSGEAFGATGTLATAIDILGNVATAGRVAFRSLEFGDTFFKVIAHEGKMWELALSAGQARGHTGDDLSDFIADFVSDPPAYAMTRVEAEAKYITLQTELDAVGEAFKTLQRVPGMRWIVPFLKTPYNSAKWAFIDHTPIGLWWGDSAMKIRAGGREGDEALGRVVVGTSMGIAAFMLTMGGQITGGGPVGTDARRTDRRLGIQPYSIKIGDTYYSYAGTEPFASTIGIWSDVAQIIASGAKDDTEIGEIVAAAVAGTAHNMTNKSFMQNFATLIEATNDPDRYSKSMVQNLIKTLVPRVVGHIERLNDPIVRETRTYLDDIMAQIPGLSENLLPVVDLWGRDARSGIREDDGGANLAWGPDLVSPIFVSRYDPTEVDLEIKRMGVRLRPAGDTIMPEGMEEPMQLSDEQRYWYQKRAGELSFGRLDAFVRTAEYKRLKEMSENGNRHITELLTNKFRGIHLTSKAQAEGELIGLSPFSEELVVTITRIMTLEAEQKAEELGALQ